MESLFAEEEIDTPHNIWFIRHSMRSIKDPVHDYSTSSKAASSAATRRGMLLMTWFLLVPIDDMLAHSWTRSYHPICLYLMQN